MKYTTIPFFFSAITLALGGAVGPGGAAPSPSHGQIERPEGGGQPSSPGGDKAPEAAGQIQRPVGEGQPSLPEGGNAPSQQEHGAEPGCPFAEASGFEFPSDEGAAEKSQGHSGLHFDPGSFPTPLASKNNCPSASPSPTPFSRFVPGEIPNYQHPTYVVPEQPTPQQAPEQTPPSMSGGFEFPEGFSPSDCPFGEGIPAPTDAGHEGAPFPEEHEEGPEHGGTPTQSCPFGLSEFPSGFPEDFSLPADFSLPSDFSLPTDFGLPSDFSLPTDFELPSGFSLPADFPFSFPTPPAEGPGGEAPAEGPGGEAPAEGPGGEAPAEGPGGEAPAEGPGAQEGPAGETSIGAVVGPHATSVGIKVASKHHTVAGPSRVHTAHHTQRPSRTRFTGFPSRPTVTNARAEEASVITGVGSSGASPQMERSRASLAGLIAILLITLQVV
ncbi:hypothetical protein M011DRAFT_479716 [Sporormia fimetaria CBS 119925]|uniref:Uncharacterized protein n=1 Tax=Sporormia fimetaria CBS 119925 TaxID=1340428 RepID=A0A6A6V5U0_9PLEO|nr:hypothetical protein M011DRAFT_479716 [Sporormia fimetaria CBS 119925]